MTLKFLRGPKHNSKDILEQSLLGMLIAKSMVLVCFGNTSLSKILLTIVVFYPNVVTIHISLMLCPSYNVVSYYIKIELFSYPLIWDALWCDYVIDVREG